MDPTEADELPNNNTSTGDDTHAWNKKRGRRVSFATEMTSVHVFDRDEEDLETPPEPKPNEDDNVNENEVAGFFMDLEDSEDFRDHVSKDKEEEDMFGRRSFLQPFESPSSGSGFGSASSNEEEDFFGPVSAEFIRPGRLSDSVVSVASDDNIEITMDSTAFSMHYRSIAMLESGELQTPTGTCVNIEEKTPTEGTQGSSMELTRYDESVPRVAVFVDKFSGGKDSSNMSLLEDNPHKYDYANMSPRFDELMSDGSKFPGVSSYDYSRKNRSSMKDAQAADLGNPSIHESAKIYDRAGDEMVNCWHSLVHVRESDSLVENEQVTELPHENNIQSSSRRNTVMDLNEDPDLNHVEAQIPSIKNRKELELDSPALSIGLSTTKEPSHIHSQGATIESSPSAFEQDGACFKSPESSVHKRRHEELGKGNEPSTSYIDKLRSTKIPKKGVTESVKQNDCSADDPSQRGSIVALRHWSDILSKALEDTENPYPALFDRLDLRKMELLKDVLTHLEKVQTVTRISNNIQTQSVGNHYYMERNRRISETTKLLEKMLYEIAKLKLLRAKKEKHLQRKELVTSGIQQCQTLKSNFLQLCPCVKCNANAGNSNPQSLTVRLQDQQNVADHEILKMRQKVGAIQRDINSLVYSFHACLKIKEKSKVVDTMTLIADRLKMRALFKSLRDGVQLWEINDMVCEKGQNRISLNYQRYLTQRFTLVASISNITVSYTLSLPNIEKKYPNMDAHIAFSNMFTSDVERKYVGIGNLVQETQVTSSVFSSLIDVLEEVKLARLEVKHLKEARFQSPYAKKLDLCLHFFDFKTGKKVNVTFDISCLSSGVYPSDILPSQLQLLATGLQVGVEKVKSGFSRILRICRCISKELGSPSK